MQRENTNAPGSPANRASRRPRWGTLVIVVIGHLLVGGALIRAFAPQFPEQAMKAVGSLVTVTITAPEDDAPAPDPSPTPGGAGDEGRKDTPREAQAPEARIPIRPTPVPRASASGDANSSDARDDGEGTGAGGDGSGTGSGAGGSGQGGGVATKPVLVSGAINDARAYPIPEGGREVRIGKSVIIALTVDTDGRPSACSIFRTSGLPQTDAITCRLALERFRFQPATNARGEPMVGVFHWQQRFFF